MPLPLLHFFVLPQELHGATAVLHATFLVTQQASSHAGTATGPATPIVLSVLLANSRVAITKLRFDPILANITNLLVASES